MREASFALHKFLRHGHKEKDELIIELKAVKALLPEHVAQLLGYLRASRKEHGLLIHFGAPILQIKKFALSRDLDSPDFSPPPLTT
ncbi:MAG: hypothetical protein RLZZ522_1371 [Verrucomicrobiota bacterium]